MAAEHAATRERVALFDLTPFAKFEVTGPGALQALQGLAANQMDRPVGAVTYTSMLTPRGGIKCDLTVTRLEEDRFLVITGGAMGLHDLDWIEAHLPGDGSARVEDLSSAYCCIGLWGPRARELLSSVCEEDLGDEAFPYLSARRLTVAEVPALALRISYVGEFGWEIYAPAEQGLRLWDILWQAGQPLGVIAAGGGAFDSLRLEKGYRLWGQDIHTEHNPYEAGLGFAVRMGKGDFVGWEALRRIRAQGVTRRLCCMTLDDPSAVVDGQGADPGRRPGPRPRDERQLRPLHRPRHRLRLPAGPVHRGRDEGRGAILRGAPGGDGCRGASVRPRRQKDEGVKPARLEVLR